MWLKEAIQMVVKVLFMGRILMRTVELLNLMDILQPTQQAQLAMQGDQKTVEINHFTTHQKSSYLNYKNYLIVA